MHVTEPAPGWPHMRNVIVSERDLRGAIRRAHAAGERSLHAYLMGAHRTMRGTTATHTTLRIGADALAIIRR